MKRRRFLLSAAVLLSAAGGCGYINQARKQITCKTCNGSGLCALCGGSGKGMLWGKCASCDGGGRCKACGGMGFTFGD